MRHRMPIPIPAFDPVPPSVVEAAKDVFVVVAAEAPRAAVGSCDQPVGGPEPDPTRRVSTSAL